MSDIYPLIDGEQGGPYTEDRVEQSRTAGFITADLPAWHEELKDWINTLWSSGYPPETENFGPVGDKVLRVVVAYEDLATAQRALRLFEHTALALKTGGHGEMQCAMWKIGNPTMPARMRIAADKALLADLIVIAAHERATMPEVLQEWIELWLPDKKAHSCGLVALLDRPPESYAQRGIYRYLKNLAHFANLVFFANGRHEDFDEILRANAPGGYDSG